ncbi:hypothetical protein L917_00610 [Phytophthora nicotianae]|uniref:MULE transposase domain-containing protein n=1 Tax=Phytophthora nicotianae TaxID=4792 RepID=W2M064_PHYNI|nr:hypothetical protein L917_00610 [Phytophthora nicotianae]
MGVADAAQWNAVNSVFGSDCDYTFLMCYFHVTKTNLRKRGYVPPARAIEVMEDIHDLHFSENEVIFHSKLAEIQARWQLSTELAQFSAYFFEGLVEPSILEVGFVTTNNPCETYNAAIKRDVTLRRKLKVCDGLLSHKQLPCHHGSQSARRTAPLVGAVSRVETAP